MRVYLVGGAVRDQLLGIPVVDRDWVVVGSSEKEMLALGYIAVGKDFPVFLHPETKEEYALARRERKTGRGYGGFDFDTSAAVSLEDDLSRRDFTINAIAQDSDGALIDPFGGQADLAARKLRHVSSAFSEDPLRILRAARFFARFHYLGFSVDSATLTMMQAMSASGELGALSIDRLWVEIAKGLGERSPDQFVEMLWQTAALRALLPEIADSLLAEDHLPAAEHDVRRRIFSALAVSDKFGLNVEGRWALLCHAVGQAKHAKNIATVPPESLQSATIEKLCAAVSAPKLACRLAMASHALLPFVYRAERLKPDYVLKIFELCDAYRQSSILDALLLIAQVINTTDKKQPAAQLSSTIYLQRCFAACASIKADKFVQHGLKGAAIAEAINHARKMAVDEIKRSL